MRTASHIRDLRERLVAARRVGDREALPGLIEGLRELASRGYRCCLVDFECCRPAYYVRVVGFEGSRVTAELEFPIEPHLRCVQRVPLSHLVDYEEAEPSRVRTIYEGMAPFVRQRCPALAPAQAVRPPSLPREPSEPLRPPWARQDATAVWWAIAGVLLLSSLAVFVVA